MDRYTIKNYTKEQLLVYRHENRNTLTTEQKKVITNRIYYLNKLCVHGRRKSYCKECDGSSICEHDRIRSGCKDCGGGSICEHGRIRSQCKDCGGGCICKHDRRRSACKDCGGGSICEHNRTRSGCKDCMTPQRQIEYTLKKMIKRSKQTDKSKNILDYNTFIDLQFLYTLLEDYKDMKCYYNCGRIMEWNPEERDNLITIERKENVINGIHQPHSKNNVVYCCRKCNDMRCGSNNTTTFDEFKNDISDK